MRSGKIEAGGGGIPGTHIFLFFAIVLATYHSPLATVSYAQTYGGGYDGYDAGTGTATPLGGSVSIRMSSAANQVFMEGDPSRPMAPMYIKDIGGSIAANNTTGDLRIHIPASFNMNWNASAATAVFGGSAASKCAAAVTFEDGNKTARIDVTGNFSRKDTLVVSGLQFCNFSAASAPDNLELGIYNSTAHEGFDSAYIAVIAADGIVTTGGAGDGYDSGRSPAYAFGSSHTAQGAAFAGVRME